MEFRTGSLETVVLNKFWENRRVLVTGHTGFKGAWLTLWLRLLGADVQGIALEPEQNPGLLEQFQLIPDIQHHIHDIRDAKAIHHCVTSFSPEVVLHLAAQSLVRRSYREPTDTWTTNVMGTINLMNALKDTDVPVTALIVTTDKVYENRETDRAYGESDPLGGHDPYSSSKAATELAVESWRKSFFQDGSRVAIATARAGNVVGGGDFSEDRIVPDIVRSLQNDKTVHVRSPQATRPWQHVLEPLSGYLELTHRMFHAQANEDTQSLAELCSAWNFGPRPDATRTVQDLVETALTHWPGTMTADPDPEALHEAQYLGLSIDKSATLLNWHPRWSFEQTIQSTIEWYRRVGTGECPRQLAVEQIRQYECE